MRKSPAARLGAGPNGIADIKKHGFFRKINWKALAQKEMLPPIIPKIETPQDLRNFHKEFTAMTLDSPPNDPKASILIEGARGVDTTFEGFSYVNRYLLVEKLAATTQDTTSDDED